MINPSTVNGAYFVSLKKLTYCFEVFRLNIVIKTDGFSLVGGTIINNCVTNADKNAVF